MPSAIRCSLISRAARFTTPTASEGGTQIHPPALLDAWQQRLVAVRRRNAASGFSRRGTRHRRPYRRRHHKAGRGRRAAHHGLRLRLLRRRRRRDRADHRRGLSSASESDREADREMLRRLEEHDRERERGGQGNGRAAGDGAATPSEPPPLKWLDMSSWDDGPPPPIEWSITNLVPREQVGLFSGVGGTGKTTCELLKDVAHVIGLPWFNWMPTQGPVLFVGCEDTDKSVAHPAHGDRQVFQHHIRGPDQRRLSSAQFVWPGRDVVSSLRQERPGRDDAALSANLSSRRRSEADQHFARSAGAHLCGQRDGPDASLWPRRPCPGARARVRRIGDAAHASEPAGHSERLRLFRLDRVARRVPIPAISARRARGRGRAGRSGERQRSARTDLHEEPVRAERRQADAAMARRAFPSREQRRRPLEKLAEEAKADTAFLDLLDRFTEQGRNVEPRAHQSQFCADGVRQGRLRPSTASNSTPPCAACSRAGRIKVETYGKASNPHQRLARVDTVPRPPPLSVPPPSCPVPLHESGDCPSPSPYRGGRERTPGGRAEEGPGRGPKPAIRST